MAWKPRANTVDYPAIYSEQVDGQLCEIQELLLSMGYPPTVDRTQVPRLGFTDKDITVVCLCYGVDRLSLLLESANHCPGNVLLVLSHKWLFKRSDSNCKNFDTLLVKQGISCEKGGNTYLDIYEPPRRVTYFFNSVFDIRLERYFENVDCPRGASLELINLMMDVLFIRLLLSKSEIPVPVTMAFCFKPTREYVRDAENVVVIIVSSLKDDKKLIQSAIKDFLEDRMTLPLCNAWVAVKLCRPSCPQSIGVQEYRAKNTGKIIAAVIDLFEQATEGDNVLVELLCIDSETAEARTDKASMTGRRCGVTICAEATVCRNPENEAVLTSVVCFTESNGHCIKNEIGYPQSVEDVLSSMGITCDETQQTLKDQLKTTSEKIMSLIMELEKSLPNNNSKRATQIDLIGIDYNLTVHDADVTPIAVTVRYENVDSHRHVYDAINPELDADTFRALLTTTLAKSLGYMLKGKKILVIDAGTFGKKFIFDAAREYGIQICLVHHEPETYAADLADEFMYYNFSDHTRDGEHSKVIRKMMEASCDPLPDGCLTIWEHSIPLVAMVCEELSLVGSHVEAAITARSKARTQQVIQSVSNETSLGKLKSGYASDVKKISSKMDINSASELIKFPVVLKPDDKFGAIGVKLVDSVESCYDYLDYLDREDQTPSCVLMEYVDGAEHVVDLVIFDGKQIAAFVHDKGPTRLPNFTKTSSCFPTSLSPQKADQIIFAAYQSCLCIGLENGIFNVDLKMTASGPKLIEINARVGGFDIRECIKRCFKVDIALCAFVVACGIRPIVVKQKASCYFMNLVLNPVDHRDVLTQDFIATMQNLHSKGTVIYNQFQKSLAEATYSSPCCAIGVTDENLEATKSKLWKVGKNIGLDSKLFPLSHCLSYFK